MRPFYPIILLVFSNIFMTFAWYGHLKYKSTALWIVILVSWGIAFFEYCLQVPANRIGHDYYLSLIHISEPTRRTPISYAVFCLKKKNTLSLTLIHIY